MTYLYLFFFRLFCGDEYKVVTLLSTLISLALWIANSLFVPVGYYIWCTDNPYITRAVVTYWSCHSQAWGFFIIFAKLEEDQRLYLILKYDHRCLVFLIFHFQSDNYDLLYIQYLELYSYSLYKLSYRHKIMLTIEYTRDIFFRCRIWYHIVL